MRREMRLLIERAFLSQFTTNTPLNLELTVRLAGKKLRVY